MTKEIAKIRNKGDITIPQNIRKQLDLKVGDHLIFITNEDKSVTIKKLDLEMY